MQISKKNIRGGILLIILILGVVVAPRIFVLYNSNADFDLNFSKAEILEKKKAIEKVIESEKNQSKKKKFKYKRPQKSFDPNNYTESDWLRLGLSKKQVAVILKFSKRGLRSNEDLKKIFVIPDELYLLIKDSTFYTVPKFNEDKKNAPDSKFEHVVYDLNLVTTTELESLPGVGPFYAKKIVEYRDDLGGYLNVDQLGEIWKFDSVKVAEIIPFVSVSKQSLKLHCLDINKVSFDDLRKHPYLSYQVANSIIKMRAQNKFVKIEDIKRSVLIDDELFEKIKYYLKCQ